MSDETHTPTADQSPLRARQLCASAAPSRTRISRGPQPRAPTEPATMIKLGTTERTRVKGEPE